MQTKTTTNLTNLCCILNPIGQCSHCFAGICEDCIDKASDNDNTRPNCPYCKWKCVVYSYPLREDDWGRRVDVFTGWELVHKKYFEKAR